ncbi:siderophore-interacting protein [Rhodococcus sp. PAM 2766]|uniref:Siderophore-interacting protein n=1 Tax=Rhodococcus parequi TaxID=3137122 RepID=A0ABW9FLC3_9NOCA
MPFCHPATVVSVTTVTPHMVRIGLEAVGDWRWTTEGWGDERIDIAFPRPGERVADIEFFNRPDYGNGNGDRGNEPPWRHYTVRRVLEEGRRIDVDFVVHPGGLASDWALRAAPGDVLGVFSSGPARAYYQPAGSLSWQLLVADATGLPGLGRIVEELGEGDVAHAVVEVHSEADRQEFRTRGQVTYTWLVGSGMGLAPSALLEAVEQLGFPEGDVYAWVACESSTSRAIRRHLREMRGLARDRHHAVGYWRLGADGHVPGMNGADSA